MNEMVTYQPGIGELATTRPPSEVLKEAQRAASALKNVVEQTGAVIQLGNSKHLKSEAWQTLGHFYGLAATTPEDKTRFVQFGDVVGFESEAELVHIATGRIVSKATSMCLSDEDRWSTRPKYEWRAGKKTKVGDEKVPLFQLRSMAQTRAISRAHANVLKWVVVLAGYNPTPAEEITGEGNEGEGGEQKGSGVKRKSEASKAEPAGEQVVPPEVLATWKRITDIPSTVAEFTALKDRLIAAIGPSGEAEYKRILGISGVQHSNEFKGRLELARTCIRTLWLVTQDSERLRAMPQQETQKGE